MTKIETEKMILKNSYGISQNGDFAADGIIKSDLEKQFHDGIIAGFAMAFISAQTIAKFLKRSALPAVINER